MEDNKPIKCGKGIFETIKEQKEMIENTPTPTFKECMEWMRKECYKPYKPPIMYLSPYVLLEFDDKTFIDIMENGWGKDHYEIIVQGGLDAIIKVNERYNKLKGNKDE